MALEVITRAPASPAHATPLLFVHGAWHGAWCWAEHFLDFFAENGYAAYAMSLRAHGNSDGRERLRWSSIAEYVEDVAQVAHTLPAPPVLIGHSMGGFVVQKYLETRAAPAGVLMSSIPPAGAMGALLRLSSRHPLQALKTFLMLSPRQLIATPALAREDFFSASLPEEQFNRYYPLIQEESFRGFLDMVLLVMGAANDQIFTQPEFHATARAYHTDAVIVPDIAHDVMLETRWQVVASHILDWLACRGL